jgi:hypothetical protein
LLVHPVSYAWEILANPCDLNFSQSRFLYYHTLKILGSPKPMLAPPGFPQGPQEMGVPTEADYPATCNFSENFAQTSHEIHELASNQAVEGHPQQTRKTQRRLLDRCPVMFGFTVPFSFLGGESRNRHLHSKKKK